MPAPLLEQLAPGGRLVIPVGPPEALELKVLTKSAAGAISEAALFPVRFVPLTGAHADADRVEAGFSLERMPLSRTLFAIVITLATAALAQGGPPGNHRGPPPEALSACEGNTAGAACSWSHDGRTMEGTCFTPGGDRPLACRPSGPPPGDRR